MESHFEAIISLLFRILGSLDEPQLLSLDSHELTCRGPLFTDKNWGVNIGRYRGNGGKWIHLERGALKRLSGARSGKELMKKLERGIVEFVLVL